MIPDSTASLQQILAELGSAGTQDADLVLMQLDPESAHLLELCAIPHLFDPDVARVLDPEAPAEFIETFMDEVQSLPSVRQFGDCLALHDVVREQLFERWLRPKRHSEFVDASRRLAEHYEAASRDLDAAKVAANEPAVMFHRIGADLDAGFRFFKELYDGYRKSAQYSACEALVRLVAEYRPVLSQEQLSWLTFYEAETARDSRNFTRAASLLTELTRQELEPALAIRAYVLLSAALRVARRREAAREYAQRALSLASANPVGGTFFHLVHQELGLIARDEGDVEEASYHLRQAIKLASAAGDRLGSVSAYNSLGTVLQRMDPHEAIKLLESGAAQLADDVPQRGQLLNNLGLAYANIADWAGAQRALEQSLAIKRASVDLFGQAVTLLNVARVYRARGQVFAARNALSESASLFETVRDLRSAATARRELARMLRAAGEVEQGRQEALISVKLLQQTGEVAEAEILEKEFASENRNRGWKRLLMLAVFVAILLLIAVAFNIS